MPPKGWKKNAAGQWYDPAVITFPESPEAECSESEEAPVWTDETEPKCDRGPSLTKISPKQRRFAKGN